VSGRRQNPIGARILQRGQWFGQCTHYYQTRLLQKSRQCCDFCAPRIHRHASGSGRARLGGEAVSVDYWARSKALAHGKFGNTMFSIPWST